MGSLLHIDSSANDSGESVTRQLSALFAATWRRVHEADGRAAYQYRDLVADPVPPIGPAFCKLGRRLERQGLVAVDRIAEHAENALERQEWGWTAPLLGEIFAADTLVVGAPMYNLGVSAALKVWIDRVSFPGGLVDAAGVSRLRATRLIVIGASGGAYGPGTPRAAMDFRTPYLAAYFGKQGMPTENMHFVNAERTMASVAPHLARFEGDAARSLEEARKQVVALAEEKPT